jgi:hypothetical protein
MRAKPLGAMGLTLAVVITGAAALWSVVAGSTSGHTAAPPPAVVGKVTPTPAILPANTDVHGALASVRQSHAQVAATIDAWLRGDADAVTAATPSRTGPCEMFATRGRSQEEACALIGAGPGAAMTMFTTASESAAGFEVLAKDVADNVTYLTAGRHPSLQLLASRDDGAYLAIVGTDARPGLQFPGPLVLGGGDIAAVYLVVSPNGQLVDVDQHIASAPPLERLQNDMRHGTHSYEIIAADASLRAREKAANDDHEAHLHDTPTPR